MARFYFSALLFCTDHMPKTVEKEGAAAPPGRFASQLSSLVRICLSVVARTKAGPSGDPSLVATLVPNSPPQEAVAVAASPVKGGNGTNKKMVGNGPGSPSADKPGDSSKDRAAEPKNQVSGHILILLHTHSKSVVVACKA